MNSLGRTVLAPLLLPAVILFSDFTVSPAYGQEEDFDVYGNTEGGDPSFESLLFEAQSLLYSGHPIDARAKLLEAIALKPTEFQPYLLLADYYTRYVGHFRLAYKYAANAEKLFLEQHGPKETLSFAQQNVHTALLYARSEAELNLDWYETSLSTLNEIEASYPLPEWYPGTKAWVLMKLGRTEEAIQTARAGVSAGADPRRTWNILGILLSVSDQRELSLQAFAEAVKGGLAQGSYSFISTPLNNAGEVYKEIFKDAYAESTWKKALSLPGGCEHILTSLNLSILHVEQLRLFQADRDLTDFEKCFAAFSEREDSEHRTLLALARGRIALHKGDASAAERLISVAEGEQQWFGKIGTNQNDVEFASLIALAAAYRAKAAALLDRAESGYWQEAVNRVESSVLRLKAWWMERRIRRFAVEELNDFEDLYIRHTDTMLEYPTLGSAIAGYGYGALQARIEKLSGKDSREAADGLYQLYLAEAALGDSKPAAAEKHLLSAEKALREFDRLAIAKLLALKVRLHHAKRGLFEDGSDNEVQRLKEELFSVHPPLLRFEDLSLPVYMRIERTAEFSEYAETIRDALLERRFNSSGVNSLSEGSRYHLNLGIYPGEQPETAIVSLSLNDTAEKVTLASANSSIPLADFEFSKLINTFITKVFAHRSDPPSNSASEIPFVKGILD